MQGKLQQTYRVSQEMGRNGFFKGCLKLSQLPRLSSLVIADDAEICVIFEFTVNESRNATIKGHIETNLTLQCQRCLEPFIQSINLDFDLLIDASDDEIKSFQQETVYTDEGYLDMFGVIEEELILALPLIVKHEDLSCNPYLQPDAEEHQAVATNNPFAVLESLKSSS